MMLLIELTLWVFLSGAMIVFMFIGMVAVWHIFTRD